MRLKTRAAWAVFVAVAAPLWFARCGGAAAAGLPPDVPGDHWAAPAIAALIARGTEVVEATPNGNFEGSRPLQKYDLVKTLASLKRYLREKNVNIGPQGALPAMPYTDVPADHYAVQPIRELLWAIPGDKNLFRGGQTMSRLDMAVWLQQMFKDAPQSARVKLDGVPAPADVDAPFVPLTRWALAAGDEGLVSSYPDGRFHPDRELTRYEMAYTVLKVLRWLTNVPKPDPAPTVVVPATQDNTPPEIRLFEPAEYSKDFLVVPRKKQIVVAGIAADDTGIKSVTANGVPATLAFADDGDLKKAELKGPVAVWFRVQVPAPEQGGVITIVATDKSGKTTTKKFGVKPPEPTSPQVIQAAAQPANTQRVARKWALLVGVNHYDDTENIPSLRYSVRDVTAVYDILTDPARGGFSKDTVFLLTDGTQDKPTNINVIKYLNRIARRAEPDDMVLVYFSGHGFEENGRGYILPCNTDIEALSASAVDNTNFIDTIDRMKAQKIVTIVDACHSGSIRRTGGGGPSLSGQFYTAYGGGKGRVVLASCSSGQKSWEDAKLGQGVFTEFVKRGMRGEADNNRDGAVTFIELAGYAHDNVEKWAKANGKEQEPMVQAENFVVSKKDIVLAVNPGSLPTGPLAEKKQKVYAKLEPEDADYACTLLEKSGPTDVEQKILKYLDQMLQGKITPQRYLDFLHTVRPANV